MPKRQEVLGFPITLGTSNELIDAILSLAESGRSSYVCVAAVHQVIEAYRDSSFRKISHGADIVTPDGMPITWALRTLFGIRQERVAGMDLLPALLNDASKKGVSVFFYGGTEEMLQKTNLHVQSEYPDLVVKGSYSPPFRPLTLLEEEEIAARINASKAQLVFVVLGCPKQERWMQTMHNRINATMVGIGAALPVMVGIQRRAPSWMQHAGLEWLYRLLQEPKRLWKRYCVTNSMFIYLVTSEKLRSLVKRPRLLFDEKDSIKQ
ncbi:MAG TPA: WecB/TagA/CpsF family glycosyltransferase [Flavitalea sp.]|nr:WecB/TagA/CpsF family glycosyltransferase [Flavitalea sp.]